MAAANTPQRYDSMAVFHFSFSLDDADRAQHTAYRNAQHLQDVWEDVYMSGFVDHANEIDMGLEYGEPESVMCDKAEAYFAAWLEYNKPKGGEKKLFVFGYFGHGDLQPQGQYPRVWQHFHLFAFHSNKRLRFDLTRLQELARDKYDSDFLFVVECCESRGRPNVGMDAPSAALLASPKPQIIETLGAGVKIANGDVNADFSRRLAQNLRSDTGPRNVRQRFNQVDTGESLWDPTGSVRAPGTYKLEYPPKGSASIVLQPVVGK